MEFKAHKLLVLSITLFTRQSESMFVGIGSGSGDSKDLRLLKFHTLGLNEDRLPPSGNHVGQVNRQARVTNHVLQKLIQSTWERIKVSSSQKPTTDSELLVNACVCE